MATLHLDTVCNILLVHAAATVVYWLMSCQVLLGFCIGTVQLIDANVCKIDTD